MPASSLNFFLEANLGVTKEKVAGRMNTLKIFLCEEQNAFKTHFFTICKALGNVAHSSF